MCWVTRQSCGLHTSKCPCVCLYVVSHVFTRNVVPQSVDNIPLTDRNIRTKRAFICEIMCSHERLVTVWNKASFISLGSPNCTADIFVTHCSWEQNEINQDERGSWICFPFLALAFSRVEHCLFLLYFLLKFIRLIYSIWIQSVRYYEWEPRN